MQFRPSRWMAASLALAGAATLAQSATAPPPWPSSHATETVAASDPVHPLRLGAFRVIVDGTTLADTQRGIGLGEVMHQGKGSEALDWLCYTITDSEPAQRVWLTSGELAFGKRIDGIAAMELPAGERASTTCPALPPKFLPVRFEDGFWLGAIDTDERKALGMPAKLSGVWSSTFRGQRGGLDLVGLMVVDVRKSRATAIYVAHGAQN